MSQSVETNNSIVEAINKLTNKIDHLSVQLSNNMIMVANIAKLAEMNAAIIKECKAKLFVLEKRHASSQQRKHGAEGESVGTRMVHVPLELENSGMERNKRQGFLQGGHRHLSQDRTTLGFFTGQRCGHRPSPREKRSGLTFTNNSSVHRETPLRCFLAADQGFPGVQGARHLHQARFLQTRPGGRSCSLAKIEQAGAEGKNIYYREHAR